MSTQRQYIRDAIKSFDTPGFITATDVIWGWRPWYIHDTSNIFAPEHWSVQCEILATDALGQTWSVPCGIDARTIERNTTPQALKDLSKTALEDACQAMLAKVSEQAKKLD